MSSLLDSYPHVSNLQTRTQALGMAVHGYSVHYLSTAGPGTACKSIWSSLVSPRGSLDCQPWGYNLSGASGLQTAYQTLPNSNFQHMVTLVKQANFLLCVDPQAAQLHDELEIEHVEQRRTLLEQRMSEVLDSFVAYLNAETDVPVITSWGEVLWRAGLVEGGISPNVVAPTSKAVVDVRAPTQEDASRLSEAILSLQPATPEVALEVEGGFGRPPMERTPRNRRLWQDARKAGQRLGLDLEEASAGGGSDGNTASLFTATLDGLGTPGDGAHAAHEFIFLDKLEERTALLALLLLLPVES